MIIELQETLESSLKEGVNLFLGAGFSIYSKDKNSKKLPLGYELNEELIQEFSCPKLTDLTKICTIIDSVNSDDLREYLLNRFQVTSFEGFYKELIKINCKRIFTTNIDNLVDCIYKSSQNKYINNVFINGSCYQDKNCIDFIPIHGNVDMPDSKFLFNKQEVSGSYRTQLNAWLSLNQSAQQLPSVFLGYSLEDVGAIESLFGQQDSLSNQKNKWILLHKKDPGSEAYFKALGFKIMIGGIKDFFDYVGSTDLEFDKTETSGTDSIEIIYPESKVPKKNYKGQIRKIDEFFLGAAPIWSDILSNRICCTSHLDEIINLLEKEKNIVVTGIPASGKSTLLLQIAKKVNHKKRVLIFNEITVHKANIIKNEIKKTTIVLVDNFASNIDAFIDLTSNPFIKLVGFDRYYNVDISSHKLSNKIFINYDVSDLSPIDIQGIYNTIPLSIRKNPMTSKGILDEIPSVFEIVNYNINKPAITKRYESILDELNQSDQILLDLLIMSCYMHSCRVPVSFDVTNSFLDDDVSTYEEVIDIMNSLKGMVQETLGNIVDEYDSDQDYYQPRSQILAETIIKQTRASHFKRVFKRFHENVPKHQIPNFYIFKRSGYDAFYVSKAFFNWRDGLEFYENSYSIDRNPFLLQQCSLYLLKKKKYTEAALKIDKALQISNKKIFSIENTHAIILFKANINSESNDPNIRETLDKSMNILKKCYSEDSRKTYHAVTFAEQSIEYFTKYSDGSAKEYLNLSIQWLKEARTERKYNYRVKTLLKQLENIV
ncbi:SIR2 family protein [Aquimarina sp. 2201CG1-2-11]|uniref:P-loop NTPase n=1 Tax=Aquimarina discodermiae TaxID=3231043 RepID=UPI0034632D22